MSQKQAQLQQQSHGEKKIRDPYDEIDENTKKNHSS
jgi:hypothetical protein